MLISFPPSLPPMSGTHVSSPIRTTPHGHLLDSPFPVHTSQGGEEDPKSATVGQPMVNYPLLPMYKAPI